MELISLTQLMRFAAALIFVLALMGGLALALRRFGLNRPVSAGGKRRLKIVEVLPIDSRRRAVILKRDDREHLVILGANGETVVESGIEFAQDDKNPIQS